MYEELDASVLGSVGRRLFAESANAFFSAHSSGMRSLYSSFPAPNEVDRANLDRVIEEEKKALSQQREAIQAQRDAWRLLARCKIKRNS